MLRGVDRIKAQFDAARASAANEGRSFADLGALASVIVRPKREEAEAHFYAMFKQTGVETIVAKLEEAVKRRTKGGAQPRHFQGAGRPAPGLDQGAARRPFAEA